RSPRSPRSPREAPGEVPSADNDSLPASAPERSETRSEADWAANSGFVSADDLASLLAPDKPAGQRKKR
ncbi:MAG TPA: hypothetical protein VGN31_07195, partial [Paraburkholderia sp.]